MKIEKYSILSSLRFKNSWFWEDRAAEDSSAQSTTQDFYLREIEYNVLFERIQKYSPDSVADMGCGDGRTTAWLASKYPGILFSGNDYSSSMVENARNHLHSAELSNIQFGQFDICEQLDESFSLIYSTRCLINLSS